MSKKVIRITVDLDDELYSKVRHKSIDVRLPMTAIIRQLLTEWTKDYEPTQEK